MKRAVFDTNVIVSGFLNPHGPPGRIVDWLRSGWVQAVLDDRILDEYSTVLQRKAFRLPKDETLMVLDAIRRFSEWVTITSASLKDSLPDQDDTPFLECATAANVVLVTGNLRHYPVSQTGAVRVISPAVYVRSLTRKN